jgi:hypothetical protein
MVGTPQTEGFATKTRKHETHENRAIFFVPFVDFVLSWCDFREPLALLIRSARFSAERHIAG